MDRVYIVFIGTKESSDQRVQGVFESFEAAENDILTSKILRGDEMFTFKRSKGLSCVFTASNWVAEIHDFEVCK